jgi:hypothetical protein
MEVSLASSSSRNIPMGKSRGRQRRSGRSGEEKYSYDYRELTPFVQPAGSIFTD